MTPEVDSEEWRREAAEIEEAVMSIPMITRCNHCGVDQTDDRQQGVARSLYPRPHNGPDGEPCPGNELEAAWVNPSSAESKSRGRESMAKWRAGDRDARPGLSVIIDGEMFVAMLAERPLTARPPDPPAPGPAPGRGARH